MGQARFDTSNNAYRDDPKALGRGLIEVSNLERRRDVEGLIRMLTNTARGRGGLTVREAAILSLSKVRDARAVPHLIPLLRDESSAVRMRAAWGLGVLGDMSAGSALVDAFDDVDIRASAIASVGKLEYGPAAPALKDLLHDASPWTRLQAAETLAILGDVSSIPLVEAAAQQERPFSHRRRKLRKVLATLRAELNDHA